VGDGESIELRRARQKAYRRRVRGTDLSPRACTCCGVVFTPTRSDARCCSGSCRAKLSRRKQTGPRRFHVANLLQAKPPNGKRVTRPSRWGNPFRIGIEAATAAEAVALFRDHLGQHPELVELGRRELRGFDLGCTCPLDQPCHADVWLQLAND